VLLVQAVLRQQELDAGGHLVWRGAAQKGTQTRAAAVR
jgi:hypothetical protein